MPKLGLASSKTFRVLVKLVFVSSILIPLFSELYITVHYAEVMPRSPEPQTGRTYPMNAQYGGTIYVSRAELDRRDFVRYKLDPISGVVTMLCFGTEGGVAAWSGWWTNPQKPYSGPFY